MTDRELAAAAARMAGGDGPLETDVAWVREQFYAARRRVRDHQFVAGEGTHVVSRHTIDAAEAYSLTPSPELAAELRSAARRAFDGTAPAGVAVAQPDGPPAAPGWASSRRTTPTRGVGVAVGRLQRPPTLPADGPIANETDTP